MSVWYVVHVTVHSTNTNSVGPPQCAQIVIYQLTSLTLLHESQETVLHGPKVYDTIYVHLEVKGTGRQSSSKLDLIVSELPK